MHTTEATLRAGNALAAARDAEIAAAREFHSAILGAKAAVIAQYGSDSAEVQAIGLKKKSDSLIQKYGTVHGTVPLPHKGQFGQPRYRTPDS